MRARTLRLAALGAAVLVATSGGARAQTGAPRKLTLSQTVDLALKVSHQMHLLEAAEGAAEARVRAAKAQRFPVLNTEGNVFVWDKRLTFNVSGMPLPPGTDTTIRDRVSSAITVNIVQPLSPLLVIGHLIGLERRGVFAARADLDRAKLDAAERAATLWLQALQAQAGLVIAEKSLAQIEAQLENARVLERGGALGTVDVLRLEAARETARGAVLRVRTNSEVLRRSLAVLLYLPTLTNLELVDDLPDPPPPPPLDEVGAVERAAKQRPEIRGAGERLQQAEEARKIAQAGYLPNVLAIASYTHNEGVGTIQPSNAAFVGLTMNWEIWNWGKTGAQVDEAAQKKRQAAIAVHAAALEVEVDARRRALDAAAAYEGLAVAAAGLRAAEEAYRIQSVRFEQGAATTTDLLEGETEVARTRTGALVTRIEYFMSLVSLSRAAGELPEFIR